ncbi:hypothetical protein MRB53_039861 [Persea americana]|nr:hypothetical protein MRB53_039861 [Persea americana]
MDGDERSLFARFMLSIVTMLQQKTSKQHCSTSSVSRKNENSTYVAVPTLQEEEVLGSSDDFLRLSTIDSDVVIMGGKRLAIGGSDFTSILAQNGYRLHDPMAILNIDSAESVDFGKNRMLSPPSDPLRLSNAGNSCIYIEADLKGQSHKRQLYVEPSDAFIRKVLSACEIVLPPTIAQSVRLTWFAMHQDLQFNSNQLIGTCQSMEWIALAATIFSIVSGLLDEKSRAALKVARMAARREDARHHGFLLRQQSRSELREKTVWSALALQPRLSNQTQPSRTIDQALPIAIALAIDQGTASKTSSFEEDATLAVQLLLSLHILFEEQKLDIGLNETIKITLLPPIIAQLGFWLNIEAWTATSTSYYGLEGASIERWAYVKSNAYRHAGMEIMERPVGVFEWLENCLATTVPESYPSLEKITVLNSSTSLPPVVAEQARNMTPRINMLDELLMHTTSFGAPARDILKAMHKCGITMAILETLPAGIATPLREAVTKSELSPANTWPDHLLRLAGREDLVKDSSQEDSMRLPANIDQPAHDINTICYAIELPALPTKTREADRNAISQLIFSEDRRLVHAASLLHFNTVQTAECDKQPDWSDAYYFDQQKRIMQFVTVRMIALPAGDALLHYDSQTPLMTEKYHLPGFASSCIMQPNGHTVTTDRSALTEEKVNWAYFHAGVSSGLRISRQAIGIDTSWLVFNKPVELTNRHAGLLLALGLNGHLRNVAKWLSFKYLTPKHAMTSLGLLLGLAASNLGSMDGLITRMLSVHISCMLPPGAAELNVSPLTQTAGLLGIGLLYHNSQHRRMSEIMLHEIENLDTEDADSGPDMLRDESYRLAAGLSLGFINLAHGSGLRGLHGLSLQDRLLRIAVGSRPVGSVHVFDKATAGAIMAIVLIFMKTNDTAVARRIDIPDTIHQFEHVRPDMLMLRTMAKHIILWDGIKVSNNSNQDNWIARNVPKCCKNKWHELSGLTGSLRSSDLPLYYMITGLAWAVSLKYAGSGDVDARNEILNCLNIFSSLIKGRSKESYYYDQKLAQAGLRRCTDVLALSAATIMAGTGDLQTFRFLRRLHGRTDSETPYGSHFAAHMAIGMLFMAGGTLTLGTSNLAIAALICSLYPLFPTDVHDNRVHLQAFRHLWVFAIESRCLVLEDIDTRRPLSIPISITLQDGSTRSMQAPCLVPDLSTIRTVKTVDTAFWPVTLDFSSDSTQRQAFSRNQVIQIRRCPTADSHSNAFWATFCALNIDPERKNSAPNLSSWILARSVLEALDQNDVELILPPDTRSSTYVDGKTMKADDR